MSENNLKKSSDEINDENMYNDDSLFSLVDFINKIRKFFPIWIAFAILAAFAALGYSIFSSHNSQSELNAIVGFSYDGIERGLDPKGQKFDINTVKNPSVIEAALRELDIDMSELESIRNAISFKKLMPQDAYDKFTIYNSILDKGTGNVIEAGEKVLETSYFPTQFAVSYDQNLTSLSSGQDVEVFNKILEKYDDYFYKTYGYNESLGNAVLAISYNDYEYTEVIDVFRNSLTTLRNYVKQISEDDDTNFRSSVTGYTIDDIYSSIDTLQRIDLDRVAAYIAENNITKNKANAIAYYEYRIKELSRQKTQYEEQIAAYDNSIKTYVKDEVVVFGNSEDTSTKSKVASEEYDKMFSQMNQTSRDLAYVKQQITFYNEKLESLRSSGVISAVNLEKVDSDLDALSKKINNLIDLVRDTTDDYYKNVAFCNAYNILVPATDTSISRLSLIISNFKMPLLILEACGIVLYIAVAYITTIIIPFKKKK